MSDSRVLFDGPSGRVAVSFPFDLDALIADWDRLRVPMARHLPDAFARDEWAYLITFLESSQLLRVFTETFGTRADPGAKPVPVAALFQPLSSLAVWLPNNVSLLGPLTTILLSLTGAPLRLKGGSKSEDLTAAFLDFAREHLPADGPLARHLDAAVRHEVFDRSDPRNAAFAAEAALRIVFGSDEAVAAVEALPHPTGSTTVSFRDRRSEAWLDPEALDETVLRTLLAVFAVYGQAGCTSPRRVVLLGSDEEGARQLAGDLAATWPSVVKRSPAPHESSSAILGAQWARALGWSSVRAPGNAAVFAAGSLDCEEFDVPLGLSIVAASEEQAIDSLPANIQTIGHALSVSRGDALPARLAARGVERFVPLARMHHFGPVWDGIEFWRRSFRRIEVGR